MGVGVGWVLLCAVANTVTEIPEIEVIRNAPTGYGREVSCMTHLGHVGTDIACEVQSPDNRCVYTSET